ncbi:agamous-like MADS-box protein AGL80 [Cajanus cajan]|uniref:Agamous-like MADS-box protein AGL80 n=1 Tax=Cajanus cajan TaxID=3821 RepID=A0A151RPQ5_CAJCA|nr:agamous-like MADS-box protein AGL80 [Cajanus cajan]KYP44521.1 Agamous-like MADS-box protein AGL80 [Cajanus cajan]
MTRRKVKLAFLSNDSQRKTSYRKRKKSLLKKTEEICTLCGIDACAIVYGLDDPEPVIWPSKSGVQNLLRRFRTLPEWEQTRKMVDQVSFIQQSITKEKEKMKKLVKENKDKEMTLLMYQCLNEGRVVADNNMTTADFCVLSSVIDQNLREITRRLETLNIGEMTPHQPQIEPASNQPQMQPPAPEVAPTEEMSLLNYDRGLDMINANPLQNEQWFMDFFNDNRDETTFWPNPFI